MPIPKPNKNEPVDKFMHRCMSNEIMLKEFPDQKQRAVVCLSYYKRSKSGSSKKRKPESKT